MIGMTEKWYPLDPALVDWNYSQTKAAVFSVVEPVDNSVWGMVISSLTAGRPQTRQNLRLLVEDILSVSRTSQAGCVVHAGG